MIKELFLLEYDDINKVYEYLIKSEYKIINEKKIKKIIINKKEIQLEEKIFKNEEIIKILIEEMNNQNEISIKYKFKNEINLIYKTDKEEKSNIFGKVL